MNEAEAERDDLQRVVDMVRTAAAEADPEDAWDFRIKMQPALNAIAAMDVVVGNPYRLAEEVVDRAPTTHATPHEAPEHGS